MDGGAKLGGARRLVRRPRGLPGVGHHGRGRDRRGAPGRSGDRRRERLSRRRLLGAHRSTRPTRRRRLDRPAGDRRDARAAGAADRPGDAPGPRLGALRRAPGGRGRFRGDRLAVDRRRDRLGRGDDQGCDSRQQGRTLNASRPLARRDRAGRRRLRALPLALPDRAGDADQPGRRAGPRAAGRRERRRRVGHPGRASRRGRVPRRRARRPRPVEGVRPSPDAGIQGRAAAGGIALRVPHGRDRRSGGALPSLHGPTPGHELMAAAASFPLTIPVPVPSSHWDGRLAADLFAPCATPWLAVFDGLAWPYEVPLGGHALSLSHADGSVAYYAHGLPDRASGEVRAGDVIGYVSDSGNAEGRGCHLHFAVGVGTNIYPDGSGNTAPWAWLSAAAVPPVVEAPPEPAPPVVVAPPPEPGPPVVGAPPLEPGPPVVEVPPGPSAAGALVA